ncbi:MAG: alanine--tRNA ligase-related protein, partial [Candidatus Hodarchaeota archaeon]
MVQELYADDMFLKEFDAEVISVKDDKFIVLNQTAFYPKSGGVAHDEGVFIREDNEVFNVVYVGKFGGKISHEVDKGGLKVGDKIKARLDWNRRWNLMRYHTAAHVLSGILFKHTNAKITGNDIDVNQGRMDFNLENFDRQLIEEMVEKANNTISQDFPVEVYYMAREEAEQQEDLIKLAMGIPKNIKTLRIVDIKGFDRQPDGGCHVNSTKEIGTIVMGKIKNKGKN